MVANIVEIKQIGNANFWALENGKVGVSYLVDLVDAELAPLEELEAAYSQFVKTLSTDVIFRVFQYSEIAAPESAEHSRREAISQIGQIQNSLIFSFEIDKGSVQSLLKGLLGTARLKAPFEVMAQDLAQGFDLSVLQQYGLAMRSLTPEEIQAQVPKNNNGYVTKTTFAIDHGSHLTGVVRLVKQPANPINFLTIARLKDQLPLPYQFAFSCQKLPNETSEALLRRKTKQATINHDQIAVKKYLETQDALTEVALNGANLFNMELMVLVPRFDERSLRIDCETIIQKLKPLGDFAFETFGALPNYLAASIGGTQHVTSLEHDQNIPSFLPVVSYGDPNSKRRPSNRSLALHRSDQTVSYFDPFDSRYDNYSACIFGKSGKGKSVLTNLLTRALHNDENVRIIKIDVGGSHSKETKLLDGEEYRLSLTEPSGINPFYFLRNGETSEDVCNVISSFLNVLMLEEGETFLSKEMRGIIETAVRKYAESKPEKPTLDSFVEFVKDFPRIALLERWTGNGTYKNAFKSRPDTRNQISQRLRYYNFSQIFQAQDPDFGQGGLAAVMAQFNMELMRSKGQRLVFIADETPFFIQRCFSFFKFSTANVRKFGGSFITIAQKSSDVVVGGDTGIIENSASKFLYSIDGEEESFAARMKIDQPTVNKIKDLKAVKGEFSEVLLLDQFGAKTLRVQLTPEEYWRVTTSPDDTERLKRLCEHVPGLTLEEAIQCLSFKRAS